MSRPQSPLVAPRPESLLQRIKERNAEHPFWGYRRIGADLRVVEQRAVNKTRGLRLMRALHLLVKPHRTLRANRPPPGTQPRPTKPNAWGAST